MSAFLKILCTFSITIPILIAVSGPIFVVCCVVGMSQVVAGFVGCPTSF